jgi:hypothetical protein
VSVLLISIAPYALAGKKKAAGECVGDSMYVDNKFGFSFVKPSDWKFQEVYKDKDIERVVIVQKSAPVPPQFTGQKKGYFTRPQLTVLAMETDQRPKDYVEFLLAEKGKDDLKKKAYNMFQLLRQDTEYVFQKKKTRKIKVGGKYGVKVVGRRQYYFAFEDDLRPLSDFISGYIFVIGGDDSVVLMEFVCEREMAKSLEPDLDMIIDGFSFASEEPEPEPEPTEDQGDGN